MLNQDFKEFLQSLNSNSVRYLIVGGYAVALHGHPRYTKDLDIWLDRERANASKLMDALNDFGFGSLGLKIEDFLVPEQVIQLGYPPSRIDLLTSIDGVEFNECFANHVEMNINEITIPLIDLASLRRNKLASGRPQDLADIAALKKTE